MSENLFLQRAHGGELQLVVLDFGLAKRFSGEEQASAQLTGTGSRAERAAAGSGAHAA